MPFVKGQSGNPGGKPKEIREVVDLARAHTPAAIASLARIAESEEAPAAAVVAACEALLNRAWGRPMQPTELTGAGGGPIQIEDARAAVLSLLETAAAKVVNADSDS